MKTKTLTCGIRIEDNRSINCGVSISNQNNPIFYLWYDSTMEEFGFIMNPFHFDTPHFYMNDLNQYINALSDIIQAMAEANEFVTI
jgi:hypothetical protein